MEDGGWWVEGNGDVGCKRRVVGGIQMGGDQTRWCRLVLEVCGVSEGCVWCGCGCKEMVGCCGFVVTISLVTGATLWGHEYVGLLSGCCVVV